MVLEWFMSRVALPSPGVRLQHRSDPDLSRSMHSIFCVLVEKHSHCSRIMTDIQALQKLLEDQRWTLLHTHLISSSLNISGGTWGLWRLSRIMFYLKGNGKNGLFWGGLCEEQCQGYTFFCFKLFFVFLETANTFSVNFPASFLFPTL